jgi:hypothetical protein
MEECKRAPSPVPRPPGQDYMEEADQKFQVEVDDLFGRPRE